MLTAIQEPLPLSAETWGTWISEESALLCTREVRSHLLPGSPWELTMGVSAREERQGKLCSKEGRPVPDLSLMRRPHKQVSQHKLCVPIHRCGN